MATVASTADTPSSNVVTVRIRRRRGDRYPVELAEDDSNFHPVNEIPANAFQEVLQIPANDRGDRLYRLLFNNRIENVYREAEQKKRVNPDQPLHSRLRIDDTAAELQALPWEETKSPNGIPLAVEITTPFARSIQPKGDSFQPLATAPIRILIILVDSTDDKNSAQSAAPAIDVAAEIESLRYILEDLQRERAIQVTLRPGRTPLKPTLAAQLRRAGFQISQGENSSHQLQESLKENTYHLVHLIAPVTPAEDAASQDAIGEIFHLEANPKEPEIITDYALLEKLTASSSASPALRPRLLILPTAGHTPTTLTPTKRLPPLAAQLVQEGIPAVLNVANTLSSQQTHDFLNTFYTELVAHGIVDLAANQGRQKLVEQAPSDQLLPLPILWTSVQDGALFIPLEAREREAEAANAVNPSPTDAAVAAPYQREAINGNLTSTATPVQRVADPVQPTINTAGGNSIGDSVNTGGDFVGRDQLTYNDFVGRDQRSGGVDAQSPNQTTGKTEEVAEDEQVQDVEQHRQGPSSSLSYADTTQEVADKADALHQETPNGPAVTVPVAQPSATAPTRRESTGSEQPTANGSAATNENAVPIMPPATPGQENTTAASTNGATQAASAPVPGPALAIPPVVSNLNVSVDLSVYEPPPAGDTLVIKIFSKSVELRYDGREYTGPNLLDQQERWEELLAARLDKARYGRLLFDSIIHDEISPGGNMATTTIQGYGRALQESKGQLRIQLVLGPNEVNLHEQQWEYLWAPKTVTPMAVLERSPFYRLLNVANPDLFIKADTQLKVLVAIANPTTLEKPGHPYLEKLSRLTVALERTVVEDALQRLKAAELVEYKILAREYGEPVTLDRLREALQEGYHVLHLLAHGLFIKDNADPYHLVLEKEDGSHAFVAATGLGMLLTGGSKLRLTVLAACQSANSETGNTLRGLAPRLITEAGIPAVIGMQEQIPITTAQLFTQHFYDDLARSGRVDMAMAATRLALYQKEDATLGAWGIPVLLMSAKDGKLLDIDPARAANAPKLLPGVKSYSQLPGGDPRPQILTQALAAQARTLGAPQFVNALQEAVDKRWLDDSPAPVQDRGSLTPQLSLGVRLRATGANSLQEAIEATKLALPLTIYGQLASALNTGKHIILIGPPGTGKTTLANALGAYAKALGLNTGVMSTTATADWTTFDTVGGYVPTVNGSLQFRPASFLSAIGAGQWLIIDEINRAEIDKAFGELFTVLSGQGVDLPYRMGKTTVRIRSADRNGRDGWIPQDAQDYDYVVHPNWRIIGTMNVYDKAALFNMSLAFMRRFAFVDVDLPGEAAYQTLCDGWVDKQATPIPPAVADPAWAELKGILTKLLNRQSVLMQKRALGPAILRDMIAYVGDRFPNHAAGETMPDIAAEAFLLYAAPQLDGLDYQSIDTIYSELATLLGQAARSSGLLGRIAAFYPTILQWSADEAQG